MTSPVFEEDRELIVRDDGVTWISRERFCRDHFDYGKGEHVVFGGPSTRGKTSLAFDLMQYTCTPTLPAFVAVSKPSDSVTQRRGTALGYRFVEEWPPSVRLKELLGESKPSGYIIWPRFGDINTDMDRAARVTNDLIMDRYTRGANPKKNKGGILVMDDTMVKAKLMGLDRPMVMILAMAGAMDLGLWIFVQKPTDSGRVTTWGYENATHLFFTKGGDARMMARYLEIIGEHGPLARRVIPTLQPFEFLYVHKVEGTMCIVGPGRPA